MRTLLRRIVAVFESLSPSERLLVSLAGGLLAAVVLWAALVHPLLAASARAGQRVDAAEQELQAVEALRHRYDEVNTRLTVVERRIRSGPPGEIFTTLERLASRSAVTVASMEPRTAPASDDYKETKVQVSLKGVTLAQVVDYLYRIESAPQLLSIKSLRIHTRGDKPDLLDVTFTVSSFEPVHS
jgi:general secretion pathway protein M